MKFFYNKKNILFMCGFISLAFVAAAYKNSKNDADAKGASKSIGMIGNKNYPIACSVTYGKTGVTFNVVFQTPQTSLKNCTYNVALESSPSQQYGTQSVSWQTDNFVVMPDEYTCSKGNRLVVSAFCWDNDGTGSIICSAVC